jgi:hypothetical protein
VLAGGEATADADKNEIPGVVNDTFDRDNKADS